MEKILKHEHLIIRSEVRNPPKCPDKMDIWMRNMVKRIGMQILDGPRSIYSDMVGNRGLTSSVILNTSNSCIHTWDEVDPGILMLDIYSCGKLDPEIIYELLEEFDPVKIEFMFINRENGLQVVDRGIKERN